DLTGEDGHPDGLCLDAEGNVWVAMHGGSQVLGLDARGAVAQKISVGARQVTACTFGGEDRSTLFITTSRENPPAGEDPAASPPVPPRCSRRGPGCPAPRASCSSRAEGPPALAPGPPAAAASAVRSRTSPVASDSSMPSYSSIAVAGGCGVIRLTTIASTRQTRKPGMIS